MPAWLLLVLLRLPTGTESSTNSLRDGTGTSAILTLCAAASSLVLVLHPFGTFRFRMLVAVRHVKGTPEGAYRTAAGVADGYTILKWFGVFKINEYICRYEHNQQHVDRP